MATSDLMRGRYILHFGLNSLISTLSFGEIFHTLPRHGNDFAKHFESVKSRGRVVPH